MYGGSACEDHSDEDLDGLIDQLDPQEWHAYYAAAGEQAGEGAVLIYMTIYVIATLGIFGGVIALLPGFTLVAESLRAIPNPLINEAISVTVLAGITGSASGGMSIALATMADTFIEGANGEAYPSGP